jgi:diaminohydroxyphosphoribosylaminopyrimidine deaminase / 5-amino-6-(5-phosphoribosylamino)uracil reductase
MPANIDSKYMGIALSLAGKATGKTSPNPAVGAVIVKNNKIIGRGYHKRAGLPHAEIEAINDAKKNLKSIKGSTLYVTLEPCCHKIKRTPPCVDTILKEGFSRVVIGTIDRNPDVKGKSIYELKRNKIEVVTDVLEHRCYKINETFFKFITKGLPFVTLKLAATLDGKIATFTGDSKWIGSEKQREYAHRLRNQHDAVIVGINTVRTDDPMLNVRLVNAEKNPIAIVLDTKFTIPLKSNIVQQRCESIVFISKKYYKHKKAKTIEKMGVKVVECNTDENDLLNLQDILSYLGKSKITSVLLEGGSKVAASFLLKRLVDKIILFYSPKILGSESKSMIGKLNISNMKDAIIINNVNYKIIGNELMMEGYVN